MIKLLIADDEPLVQIGLNSMLDWASLDIEVCGIASNGDAAYELIRQHHPEIVITDIQMPCSSGLDLVKRCRKEFGDLPVFIILTSHENFNYAKEAISCRVIDYLVKIDLSPETLTESIDRALKQVASIRKRQEPSMRQTDRISDVSIMQERFFIRLLNNLFENETQYLTQAKELNLSFPYAGYAAAHLEMQLPGSSGTRLSQEQLLKLYNSTLHMFQELLGKYLPCRVIPLDTRRLAAIFYIQEENISTWKDHLSTALHQAFDMLFNYYSVKVLAGIGRLVSTPMELSVSYNDARQLSGSVSETDSFLYWDSMPNSTRLRNVFNLSLFRKEIAEAFETLDETALHSVFSNICSLQIRFIIPRRWMQQAVFCILPSPCCRKVWRLPLPSFPTSRTPTAPCTDRKLCLPSCSGSDSWKKGSAGNCPPAATHRKIIWWNMLNNISGNTWMNASFSKILRTPSMSARII